MHFDRNNLNEHTDNYKVTRQSQMTAAFKEFPLH